MYFIQFVNHTNIEWYMLTSISLNDLQTVLPLKILPHFIMTYIVYIREVSPRNLELKRLAPNLNKCFFLKFSTLTL